MESPFTFRPASKLGTSVFARHFLNCSFLEFSDDVFFFVYCQHSKLETQASKMVDQKKFKTFHLILFWTSKYVCLSFDARECSSSHPLCSDVSPDLGDWSLSVGSIRTVGARSPAFWGPWFLPGNWGCGPLWSSVSRRLRRKRGCFAYLGFDPLHLYSFGVGVSRSLWIWRRSTHDLGSSCRTLGCRPVGDGTSWLSIGGDSRFILGDLGNVGPLFDVTGQSDCPRTVLNMEQIMDAPGKEDVLSSIELERRRLNLVVDREPSSSNSWVWRATRLACTCTPFRRHGYHHGVARLSHMQKLLSSVRLLCRWVPSLHRHPTCLDWQFLSMRMMSSWVIWVFTPGLMGPQYVLHRSRTTKVSPDGSAGFTHTKRSVAAKEILKLVATGQSQLTATYTPLRVSRIGWGTSRARRLGRWSWCSSACATVLQRWSSFRKCEDVVWTLSHATTKIIMSRVGMRAVSLRSNWLPCTLSLQWTSALVRWLRDGEALAFFGCRLPVVARADSELVHRWNGRLTECGRRCRHGGDSETDSELGGFTFLHWIATISLSTTCVDFDAPPLTMEDSRAKSLKDPQKSNAEQTQTTPHMTHTTLHARRTPHIPHKFNQHVLWLITTLQKVNLIIFENFWEWPSSPSSPSHPACLPKSSKNLRRNSNIRKS